MNNAARNAYDQVVRFHILPMPRQETVENLRFVIANQVSGEHATRLTAAVPDLGQLFRMQAFGIYDDEKARKDGYYGAQWFGDNFVAWFHWPVAGT